VSRLGDRLSRVRWKRLVLVGGGGGFLVLLALFGIAYAATDVPDPNKIATAQATVVLYSDGGEIGRIGQQNRRSVPLENVPDHVQKAVLAAEDRGFYTEPGISPKGIARALFTNIRGGGSVQQGGSTITQQYAKNAFLTQERTYTRKVKEVFIALKMSRTVDKDQILEDYLNTIYFGRGASGIEVASEVYFGKPAKELTPAEGAVLASVIRSPAAYDPTRHPDRAVERFDYVLDGMEEKGWLEPGERAAIEFPKVKPPAANGNNDLSGPKGHVISQVMEELQRREFGEDRLAAGGLTVRTTLRQKAQEAAVRAVQERTGKNPGPGDLQGALVAVKPGTGEVFAYYGGATGTGFDFANQAVRQPGSSFKPYVLAAALQEGISLKTRWDGNDDKEFGPTKIDNFGDESYGQVDLVEATQKSVNTAYYELCVEVGAEKVAELAHKAGIPDSVRLADQGGDANCNIALGGYEVHVFDQAVGFATFGANGDWAEPLLVKDVRDGDGDTVYEGKVKKQRAFEKDVAADATFAMRQVVERGTGTRAQLAGGRPAAGKTGTTSKNVDAWFAGYTPQLAAAVWLGHAERKPIVIDGRQATGGTFASTIWKSFMDAAMEGLPIEQFPPRADVGSTRGRGGDQPTSRPTTTASPTATSSPTGVPTQGPPTGQPTQPPPPTSQPTQPPPTTQPTTQPTSPPPEEPAPSSAPPAGGASPAP
jgi:membrane peptidoglycan carboxypeptidase